MNEETGGRTPAAPPEAKVQTRRGFSLIWVVPIVALVIGGWIAFKAMSEKGPEITILFENAEGLEADKTRIKYKDVEVGRVTGIELSKDLAHVVVTAEMAPEASRYLTEGTRFWVVRARVAAGEVSGLGTLFSGAYIGVDPRTGGKETRQFKGLEEPPVLTEGLPGAHFVLEARELGSLDIGSPVYYRGIEVGQVVSFGFDESAEAVIVRVFIRAPYHQKVRQNSRFWNASGVDFQLDTEGIRVDTESLVSIALGGVAFDLPSHLEPAGQAEEERVFTLYPNRRAIDEKLYTVKRYYMAYFDQNVRGLAPGAPVEVKGIPIGEVVDVQLEVNADTLSVRVPVKIMLEPERIDSIIEGQVKKEGTAVVPSPEESHQVMERFVAEGMRAQLKTGNLLTGQLYVDLDFYPEATAAKVVREDGYLVIPTVPAPLEQIVERVESILRQVEAVPFAQLGGDLRLAIADLRTTLQNVGSLSSSIDEQTLPRIHTSLEELERTLEGVRGTLGPDSPLNDGARRITDELQLAIRSLRSLIDYLDRDPQALIFGKEEKRP